MSYLRKIEYEIVLKDSFWIIRNCPKCGRKAHYINTKKFRVNANGNILDIWLIYQCAECKHTLNLAIYGRKKVSSITKDEYQCFLDNSLRKCMVKICSYFRQIKQLLILTDCSEAKKETGYYIQAINTLRKIVDGIEP